MLEKPDTITASAAGARDEIGRAVAARIRESRSAEELAVVAEDVLPEIEKFLESPEEKRMRRMRAGMIVASIGAGAALGVALVSLFLISRDTDLMFLISIAGVATFFVGIGLILNGVFLTVPRRSLPERSADAEGQRDLDLKTASTSDLSLPSAAADQFSSVTENTTRHLEGKPPLAR